MLINDREIALTRTYDVPRSLVWRAWTEPDQIAAWWGPNGFSTTNHEMSVHPGGVWRFNMRGPDGTDYPNKVVYTEIVEPSRLAYDHGDDERVHFTVVVTFEERDGKTEVTLHSTFPTAEARDAVVRFGAVELGGQTLACLADHLARM
ncbi:ATPase [bacterium]|nr:MAG: ATPase [bacterium]